jgi:hypothetical protein
MNPEIKARWGEWLLAHADEQGRGALRQVTESGKEEFCCLGGLCDLAVEAGIVVRTLNPENGRYRYATPDGTDWAYALLPSAVTSWAGLTLASPVVTMAGRPEGRNQDSLASLNDTGTTFPEIWQLINSQL